MQSSEKSKSRKLKRVSQEKFEEPDNVPKNYRGRPDSRDFNNHDLSPYTGLDTCSCEYCPEFAAILKGY